MTRRVRVDHRGKPEGAIPNWLISEEQHMKIKREIQLLNYQISFYSNEIRRMQKKWDKLKEGAEHRAQVYGAKYKTRKELDDAYLLGGMTVKEYMQQRSAIWQAYSDRGYDARIKWLQGELDKYQTRKNRIDEWRKKSAEERIKRIRHKENQKWKQNTWYRNRERRKRKEALEARWKKYGIG